MQVLCERLLGERASDAPVAVFKWMDRLELGMRDRRLGDRG